MLAHVGVVWLEAVVAPVQVLLLLVRLRIALAQLLARGVAGIRPRPIRP